jgi:hypothetical protein
VQRNKALGIAAPEAKDWKLAMYCPKPSAMPGIRDVSPGRGEPFDDKGGERRRFQHVSDQPDKVDFRLAVVVPVVGVLRSRDLGIAMSSSPPSGPLIATLGNDLIRGNRLELAWFAGIPTPMNGFIYAALKPYVSGTPK